MSEGSLTARLAEIQRTLHAPKNQFNSFGKYNYRNKEDILEAVKPLLKGLVLTITDTVINVGDRYYFKSIAQLTDGENTYSNEGWAREDENKKGMDLAQLSGACSSYSGKYALGNLLLLDDTKDSDSQDNRTTGTTAIPKAPVKPKLTVITNDDKIKAMKNAILTQCKGGEGETKKEEAIRRYKNAMLVILGKETIDSPEDMTKMEDAIKEGNY
jgi:hypothetical protein